MKKLYFTIINYNDYETTETLIGNIKNYKSIYKIVIVDNNSTDDSFIKLKELVNDKILVVKNSNSSYASGINFAAKTIFKEEKCFNMVVSNSDIIIKNDDDLNILNNDFKNDIGVVAPVINTHGEKGMGWPITTPNKEILFNIPLISRYFRKKYLGYNDSYYKDDVTEVSVVSGCFFLISSDALKSINFLDEGTHLYYEENILSIRLRNKGFKELIDKRVEVIHNHSVSIDKSINRINKYKELKKSQKYYVYNYLNPNIIQKFLLFLMNKLSLLILYIRCLFSRS